VFKIAGKHFYISSKNR